MTPLFHTSRQLLLCLARDWDAPRGYLQRYERSSAEGWVAVGREVQVTLGRTGLAWGRGLHPSMPGRQKEEGDARAPAGAFGIGPLFGYAGADSELARAAKLPYRCASDALKCIDDPLSAHYNCLVDQSLGLADWVSCEAMLRDDARYELGVVVEHNVEPAVAGCGSCIFMHVWAAPGVPTAGCTAMSLEDIGEIATWLDGSALPLLVQLPWLEYKSLRQAWGLPLLAGSGLGEEQG